ncbi:LuxR family transcriptional regulator [Rhizobium sp. ICMP 5592]|uniref:helix-turn-helix transcriptional regulator n=1 Tax=Rhizobium sp. ICMP 5592 TaxID=2292445 RepID=UPI0012964EBC|nr:LuxR family transcriptional regulator [Rhizobium sp. ICMP 5592]MQB46100.1 LuxR family transcriptional regulator [Rhizobium sp. ICMP 5592]
MKTWMLPPLEKACLRWVFQGRPLAEIALLEGKSVPEIELYLKRALVSLEAKSIKEAIEKANLSQSD